MPIGVYKRKPKERGICLWCNEEFEKNRKEQVFCSISCSSTRNGHQLKS